MMLMLVKSAFNIMLCMLCQLAES